MKKIEVRRAKNGRGIFATKNIKSEEIIFEIKGVFVTGYEDEIVDEEVRSNTFRFSKEKYISPQGNIGDFLNHSCKPNAKVIKTKNKLYLVALGDITKDTEVVMDYSTITASDDAWEMKCNCGQKDCRGLIGQFYKLPPKLKSRYISHGMVPNYILD